MSNTPVPLLSVSATLTLLQGQFWLPAHRDLWHGQGGFLHQGLLHQVPSQLLPQLLADGPHSQSAVLRPRHQLVVWRGEEPGGDVTLLYATSYMFY